MFTRVGDLKVLCEKKRKLASGCPRSTMNLSFDVVVFSSSMSEC